MCFPQRPSLIISCSQSLSQLSMLGIRVAPRFRNNRSTDLLGFPKFSGVYSARSTRFSSTQSEPVVKSKDVNLESDLIDPSKIKPKSSAYAKKELFDPVYIRPINSLISVKLPSNYRASYFPLYTAPSTSYISLMKRILLGAGAIGAYVSHLISISENLSLELAAMVAVLSILPIPVVQYFSRDYVTRIFRLYDSNKNPQTYENLTQKEELIMEKMGFGGKRYYNELIDTRQCKIVKNWYGAIKWEYTDKESGVKRYYYVTDDLGGIKMDRIWGIIETNSGMNNGRYHK